MSNAHLRVCSAKVSLQNHLSPSYVFICVWHMIHEVRSHRHLIKLNFEVRSQSVSRIESAAFTQFRLSKNRVLEGESLECLGESEIEMLLASSEFD